MKKPSKKYLSEKTWEEKARENPLYGVMSHEEFADSGPEPSQQELEVFYSRGEEMVGRWIAPWLAQTNTSNDMSILEFGCGMGRITGALSKKHPPENIAGIDISETMIGHAIANTAPGIVYRTVNDDGSFPFGDASFDRIYSYAVFQHISKRSVIKKSISELARILKPGGSFLFNFEMIYPPDRSMPKIQDTFALENSYFVYGSTNFKGFPVWRLRKNKANNWGGIRLGYKQLSTTLEENHLHLHSIQREPDTPRMVWFRGEKNL